MMNHLTLNDGFIAIPDRRRQTVISEKAKLFRPIIFDSNIDRILIKTV